MTRVWWRLLHAILPWWALRRVCDLCEEFHHDPRDKEWWDAFFQEAGIRMSEVDLSTIEIRDNTFTDGETP